MNEFKVGDRVLVLEDLPGICKGTQVIVKRMSILGGLIVDDGGKLNYLQPREVERVDQRFKHGDRVCIDRGPSAGLRGEIVEVKGQAGPSYVVFVGSGYVLEPGEHLVPDDRAELPPQFTHFSTPRLTSVGNWTAQFAPVSFYANPPCPFCERHPEPEATCACSAAPGERLRARKRAFEAEIEVTRDMVASSAGGVRLAEYGYRATYRGSTSAHPTRGGAIAALWEKIRLGG